MFGFFPFLNCYLFTYSANVMFLERQCNSCILSSERSWKCVGLLVIIFFFFEKKKSCI